MMDYRKQMLDYLWNKAQADKSKARGSLYLLLEDGVGIGAHSVTDYHKNLDEALDILVDATDRIEVLCKEFPELTRTSTSLDEPPF